MLATHVSLTEIVPGHEAMKCVGKRRSIVEVVVLSIVQPRHWSELDRMISSEMQENVWMREVFICSLGQF